MPTVTTGFSFGRSRTGLTDLRAQPRDAAGMAIGSAITGGFAEIGAGIYQWTGTVPDGTVALTATSAGTAGVIGHAVIAWTAAVVATSGDGDTDVDHNTGGTDNLRFVTAGGQGIDGATITAYLASDYDAGAYVVRGQTMTKSDGRWVAQLRLNTGLEYVFRFEVVGSIGPVIVRRTL